MTGEGRSESAGAELDLAGEERRAAEALLADGLPRIAVGRMYFAVFHAVRAQLYAEGYEPARTGELSTCSTCTSSGPAGSSRLPRV